MKSIRFPVWLMQRLILIGGLAGTLTLAAQTYTATPIAAGSSVYDTYPYNCTGMLIVPQKSSGLQQNGSGAVVKNPRVVVSCAHVVFDTGAVDPWLNGVRWYRAWASSSQPTTSAGILLRGYYYYVSYASLALNDQTSPQSFSRDFVVHYAYVDTANGWAAGYWPDGVSLLKSSGTKLITGYPSGLYASGDVRKYLMHQTGPFTRAFTVNYNDYLGISEVSAGGGNSGGPVWVSEGSDYFFAGVLVSGLERSGGDSTDYAGVYGVDSSSTALINDAISASLGTVVAATITTQPTSRRVNAGDSVSFTVVAAGSNLSYRWLFNGSALAGATNTTLTLNNVSSAQAGTYQVVVSNSGGETRSTVVTLAVDARPAITTQPTNQTVSAGQSVTLSVSASGSPAPTYQWWRNGVAIASATNATLTLSSPQPNDAGTYTVVVTNSIGSATSSGATLAVNYSRITNMSVRTNLASGQTLIVGFVTTGPKPILVRGVGPGMHTVFPQFFSATDVFADPLLELYNQASGARIDLNDNWAGSLSATFASVGAFALIPGSKDAALVGTVNGPYTAQLKGTGSGVVLVDAYDTTMSVSPRLKNVSARNQVGTGANILIAGFVIEGNLSSNLLIRGIGPALRDVFGVSGVLADPKLELYNASGVKINENDNWSASLVPTFDQVGAYRFTAGSKDAALLITLPPGVYTAQVSGVGGTSGDSVVEVYEVNSADAGQETAAPPTGMVFIPGGTFTMGDSKGEGASDELPTHAVTVSPFYLWQTELTYAQWKEVYEWNQSGSRGYDFGAGAGKANDHPVESISWWEAVKWCNAKSRKDGLTPCYYTDASFTTELKAGTPAVFVNWAANGYRLPTEAEWEYAARGGLAGKRFPWGDTITHQQANYQSTTSYAYDVSATLGYHPTYATGGYPYTSPVGSFAANDYGLQDMAGNVLEWCWDWYGSYGSAAVTAPHGPTSGSGRVIRGGGWGSVADGARSANRNNGNPDGRYNNVGFRPARSSVP